MIIDYITEKVSVRCKKHTNTEVLSLYRLYEYVFHFCEHAGIASRSALEHDQKGFPKDKHFDLPDCPIYGIDYAVLTIDGQSVKATHARELSSLLTFASGIPSAKEATFEAEYNYNTTGFYLYCGWDNEFHPAHEFFSKDRINANKTERCIQLSTIINNGSFDDNPYCFISSPFGKEKILANDQLPWSDEQGENGADSWLGEWVYLIWNFKQPADKEKINAVEEVHKAFQPKYDTDNVYDNCSQDYDDVEEHGAAANVQVASADVPDFLNQLNRMQELTAQVSEGSFFFASGSLCSTNPENPFSVAKLIQEENGHFIMKFVNL